MDSTWEVPKNKRSEIWKNFLFNKIESNLVKCKLCGITFKFHNSTSTMRYHLQSKHKMNISLVKNTESSVLTLTDTQQPTILSYFHKESKNHAELVLANMVAIDRIPFATLATSTEIKNGWKARDLIMPETAKGIRNKVYSFGEQIKVEMKIEIKEKRDAGERFSLSLDEWTSNRNRRYICVNIHATSNKLYGLGMIRAKGSMPATKIVELVIDKLKTFNLNLKDDIVAVVTDGASVMKRMGQLMGVSHQLCHSHGIHLAVTDVLYKKTSKINKDEELQETENTLKEIDSEDDVDEEEEENEIWHEEVPDDKIEFQDKYQVVIDKVRKIVKIFHKSPVKNDRLQQICLSTIGKVISLVLDTPTRWNSMYKMVKRFLEVKSCVANALSDLSLIDLFPSTEEIKLLSEMAEVLEYVEASVLSLGRRDCDLIKADIIFEEFLLKKLKNKASEIGKNIYIALKKRIGERRNSKLLGLLKFLNDPTTYNLKLISLDSESLLPLSTKSEISNFAKEVLIRPFQKHGAKNKVLMESEIQIDYTITEPPKKGVKWKS